LTVPDVVASIVDNDTAGVNVVESGGSTDVTEGGSTDTFDVSLSSSPVSPVTITLAGDPQVTTSTATLTFDSSNWNLPQTVTAIAIDDNAVEGPTYRHDLAGCDERRPDLQPRPGWHRHREHH